VSGFSRMPLCGYYSTPTAAEQKRNPGMYRDGIVLGCENEQAAGRLYFFVPVHGGAVRVGVCKKHADLLEKHHGTAQPAGAAAGRDGRQS
jgi:hypothetical protein